MATLFNNKLLRDFDQNVKTVNKLIKQIIMVDIRHLQKEADILNSEGMILGLFKDRSDKLYLGSYLSDQSGTVYYSTELVNLKKYFNSEIDLKELYNRSDDGTVSKKNGKEITSVSKNELSDFIKCGNKNYSELSSGFKNQSFEEKYKTN